MPNQLKYIVTLDGVELTAADVDGFVAAGFEYSEGVITTSQRLCFYGAAKKRLLQLTTAPIPQAESVPIVVRDRCCVDENSDPLVLVDGIIKGSDIEYCKNGTRCSVCATITPNDAVSQKLECLKNHFPWCAINNAGTVTTDGENTFRTAPLIVYCKDPSEFTMIIGQFVLQVLTPVILVVAAIVFVINLIIDAVNLIPPVNIPNIDFDGNDDTNIFQDAINILTELVEAITGCGRKHKAPFIHSYLENLCQLCGMTLKSSLFEPGGVYHNTMRLDAANERGDNDQPGIENAWEVNKPSINGVELLDSFAEYNIDWRITKDCQLCVEHEDVINDNAGELLDMQTLTDNDIVDFCITYSDNEQCAYGIYEYAQDGLDASGNEHRLRWADFSIDWNTPPVAGQSGPCKTQFQYSAAKFRRDALQISRPPIDRDFGVLTADLFLENALLLPSDKTAIPKLLIWDGVSPLTQANVTRTPAGDGLFQYNAPWRVSVNQIGGVDTAYQNLLFSDDPRSTSGRFRNFTLTVLRKCEQVQGLQENGRITILCDGETFNGIVETVSFDAATMTIKGKF